MPTRRQSAWLGYVGAAIASLGFAWQLASGWFSLVQRTALLEQRLIAVETQQHFVHGDLSQFVKEGP